MTGSAASKPLIGVWWENLCLRHSSKGWTTAVPEQKGNSCIRKGDYNNVTKEYGCTNTRIPSGEKSNRSNFLESTINLQKPAFLTVLNKDFTAREENPNETTYSDTVDRSIFKRWKDYQEILRITYSAECIPDSQNQDSGPTRKRSPDGGKWRFIWWDLLKTTTTMLNCHNYLANGKHWGESSYLPVTIKIEGLCASSSFFPYLSSSWCGQSWRWKEVQVSR